jgi:hypothetical protein
VKSGAIVIRCSATVNVQGCVLWLLAASVA